MKYMMTVLALASLPALAACGQERADNNVTAEDINRLGTAEPEAMTDPANALPPADNGAEEASAPQPSAAAPTAPDAAEPRPKAPPAPRRERPAPPPPADPHAGMDMGNMANMSH